jgi:hypothetical protein
MTAPECGNSSPEVQTTDILSFPVNQLGPS